jgi:uncharacterized protein
MFLELSGAILHEFDELETSANHFAHKACLACPVGCGKCCLSESVSATVLEMLPLAVELIRRGEAELWFSRLKTEGKRCAFYRPKEGDPAQGRCAVYRWRAVVCRLFPFAAERNKNGQPRFSACKTQKDADQDAAQKAADGVANGSLKAPTYLWATQAIANLEPRYGTALFPINEAISAALSLALTEQGYK